MKKIYLSVIVMVLTIFGMSGCVVDGNEIVVAEVTHSVFYAPFYVALEKDMFSKEGLDVSIITTNGADKTMAALLSGDAHIGLMGTEASIYVYNQGQSNYSVCFAQLTQRDGSFVVGRKQVEKFEFSLFNNAEILGGRKGGMPEMTLEYVLKQNGLEVGRDDSTKGTNVRTDIAFSAQAGAFISGVGDYTTLFEPTATQLENSGQGYVIMSVGKYTDPLPYTVFSSLKDYMNDHEDEINRFVRALENGLNWIHTHSAKEIAEVIAPQFMDTTISDLTKVMQRYIDIEAWPNTLKLEKQGYLKLLEIMEEAGELTKRVDYNIIVDNRFV